MAAPPAWLNPTTPAYATVLTGNIGQTEDFTTVGTTPRTIGFQDEATWSDRVSWTATDPSGIEWVCNTGGIYNLRATQNLIITAPAGAVSTTIPNTTFYLDLDDDTGPVGLGTLEVSKEPGTETVLSSTQASTGTILMAQFITPPGFVTSTTIPGADWDVVVKASTDGTASVLAPTPPEPFTAQYYKSASQNAPSGATEVTFDVGQYWNNTAGYITHTNGTADFVCQQAGVYQLEFAVTISANGSTWSNLIKDIYISVTRIGVAEQIVLLNRFNITSPNNWANSVVGTIPLEAGDIIQCVVGETVTGTPLILGLLNTFDYNTTFTFTFIKQLENTAEGMNSLYYSVYAVDADGISNEDIIVNGSTGLPATVINQPAATYYHLTQTIPPTVLSSVTRRIIIKLFATFSTPSSIELYFRGTAVTTALTTLSQVVDAPVIRDVVNIRLNVVSATTTEFNQVIQTSIPVAMAPGEVIAVNNAVSGYVRTDEGSVMSLEVVSVLGNVGVVSGFTILPSPNSVLGWNLIAQGPYGNAGVIV